MTGIAAETKLQAEIRTKYSGLIYYTAYKTGRMNKQMGFNFTL